MSAFIRNKGSGVVVQYNVLQPTVTTPAAPSPAISGRIDRYNISGATWDTVASMGKNRAGFAFYPYLNKLIAIGGTDGSVIHGNGEIYDITSNTWSAIAPPSIARCFFQSVQIGNNIYCIGGITADAFGNLLISQKTEVYSPATNTWTQLSDMPTGQGVALGVAAVNGNNIYILSGYRNQLNTLNTYVNVYNTISNTWTTSTQYSTKDQGTYKRLLPFAFINNNLIYVTDGIFYYDDPQSGVTKFYQNNCYIFNPIDLTITTGDRNFRSLPISRFGGASVTIGTTNYFIGGTNDVSNSLKYFESINTAASPFSYTILNKLPVGRSSLGIATVGSYIYAAGGVGSTYPANYLKIQTTAIPNAIELNGTQTGAVDIFVTDENGDSPSNLTVRVTAQYRPSSGSNAVLFTSDNITVTNGYGMATLLPRAEDANQTDYSVAISASVLDSFYTGETTAILLPPPTTGITSGSNQLIQSVTLPTSVKKVAEYDSVVNPSQARQGAYLQLQTIAGFLTLTPTFTQSNSTTVHWKGGTTWLPVVDAIQDEFGGSTLLDGLAQAAKYLSFDHSGIDKIIYLQSDCEENFSHNSLTDVDNALQKISPLKRIPIVTTVFQIVPDSMHLSKGNRNSSVLADSIAGVSNGSEITITSDSNFNTNLETILTSRGFVGNGTFTFEVDLGEEVLIQSLQALFDIVDAETGAFWQYEIGDSNHIFSFLSENIQSDIALSLQSTYGRYVRITATLFAALTTDLYLADKIIPPSLTSFFITYHKKTTSYIYFNDNIVTDPLHQIMIAVESNRPVGSEINIGVTTQSSGDWEDYYSSAKPSLDNGTRIILPIRQRMGTDSTATLETLVSIDGFAFKAKYGKWAEDSLVQILLSDGTVISSSIYQIFPNKGLVVFSEKQTDTFLLSITNQPDISVAAEIVNRVNGQPIVITGAGYMYSSLKLKNLSQSVNRVVPEALNAILTPVQPNSNSVFVATYTFYDLKGRAEANTTIRWFINSHEETDLANLVQWDNKTWKLAKSGDVVYYIIRPGAKDGDLTVSGVQYQSLPVTLL
jgi:hypothetical protein